MGSTFLTFVDKYYEYDGMVDVRDRGLTIGGYESAWLADLVISYIFENTEDLFTDSVFHGCYRDDELAIFKGTKMKKDMISWLNTFQNRVNELLDSDNLQFTLTVWGADKEDSSESTKVTVDTNSFFPFLDMELFWNNNGELNHRVHLKENQELKYLNKGSCHTKACFKAIYNGVSGKLAKLTELRLE